MTSRYPAPAWQQELLLRAALLEGPAASAAREQWRLHVDPEQLDYHSQRLLPQLYRALQARGISTPDMGRLKGVYRRTWYENTVRFHAAARLLQGLHDAGIKTMLLGGAALTIQYYRDCGLRPIDALEILVPTHQAIAAVDVLKTLGLTPISESVGSPEAEGRTIGHAYPFRDAGGHQVDLRWHVFNQRLDPQADAELWTAALPATLHGAPTRTLSPADQLLHLCVHETPTAWWGEARPPDLRWVADAMAILTGGLGEQDWNRLFAQAQRLQFVLPLREALAYLRDTVDAPIPADVMGRARRMRVSLEERIADRARTRPPGLWGPWVALGVRYLEYSSSLPADIGLFRRLAGLPRFFQHRWGQAPLWHLPFAAAFRGLRRIRWAVEGHRSRQAST